MILIVGDIHAKTKEPFRTSIKKLFDFLYTLSPDVVILLGDLFDSSSPHHAITFEVMDQLLSFKQVFILSGNHDYSKIKGNVLKPLSHHDNIEIIDDVANIAIEGLNCLFLPYKYANMKEEYEALEGTYDYIFTHITPLECAFGDEGIDLKLEGNYIHGHTHISKVFADKQGNPHWVLGVPIPTRHLEQDQVHKVMTIDKGVYDFIEVPQPFTYETINFGDEPQSKDNIINVKNAPSVQFVFEKYKDYYIREEGIEITYGEGESSGNVIKFDEGSISQQFIKFCIDQEVDEVLQSTCLSYITM